MDISIVDSNNNVLNIYINNQATNIEDKLVAYLEEKKEDRKVSKIYFKFIK